MTFTEVLEFCDRRPDWLSPECRAAASCPECRALYWYTGNFWACPRGHGRLVPTGTLVARLAPHCLGRDHAEQAAKNLLDEQKKLIRFHKGRLTYESLRQADLFPDG